MSRSGGPIIRVDKEGAGSLMCLSTYLSIFLLHINLQPCYFNVEGQRLFENLAVENLLIVS